MCSFRSFQPQRGRLFGDTAESPDMNFRPDMNGKGEPILLVRTLGRLTHTLAPITPTVLLIELDEHPGIPFLAWARLDGDAAIAEYAAVELHPIDGCEIPPPGVLNTAHTR